MSTRDLPWFSGPHLTMLKTKKDISDQMIKFLQEIAPNEDTSDKSIDRAIRKAVRDLGLVVEYYEDWKKAK